MKFFCDYCQAKYAIDDAKIAGRVLRMKCRRCGHEIELQGPGAGHASERLSMSAVNVSDRDSTAPIAGSASQMGKPTPMPARPSQAFQPRNSVLSAGGAMNVVSTTSTQRFDHPIAATPSNAAFRPAANFLWHVAINNVPVGPMKLEEVERKAHSGVIRPDTLVWREGFAEWVPIVTVNELNYLVNPNPAPAPEPKLTPPAFGRKPAPDTARMPRSPSGPIRESASALSHAAEEFERKLERKMAETEPPIAPSPSSATKPPPSWLKMTAKGLGPSPATSKTAAPQAPAAPARPLAKTAPPPSPSALKLPPPSTAAPAQRAEALSDPTQLSNSGHAIHAMLEEEGTFTEAVKSDASMAQAIAQPEPHRSVASEPHRSVAPEPRRSIAPVASAAPAPRASRGLNTEDFLRAASLRPRTPMSPGVWVAIVGSAAFGMTLAVFIGMQMFKDKPEPVKEPEPKAVVQEPPSRGAITQKLDVPEVPKEEVKPETKSKVSKKEVKKAEPVKEPSKESLKDKQMLERMGGTGVALKHDTSSSKSSEGEGLEAAQLIKVVTKNRPTLQRCYEIAARGNQAATVRIDVDITVGNSGTVTGVKTRGQSIGNMSDCIREAVKRWRFPAADGSTQTTFPVVFQPGG